MKCGQCGNEITTGPDIIFRYLWPVLLITYFPMYWIFGDLGIKIALVFNLVYAAYLLTNHLRGKESRWVIKWFK